MKTRLTRSPRVAAEFIRRGEIVAFPTETVYGLGASVYNETAIRKIFAAKGRPADNPLIAHVASVKQIPLIVREVPPMAAMLIGAFFPGPLTLVLPRHSTVSKLATGGLETIGVRMPSHPIARELIRECGVPLVAPSANLSGRPSPTTWQAVKADLDDRISCILKGTQTELGLESTVLDCTGRTPVILRSGAVTAEQLRSIIPSTKLARRHDVTTPKSPGVKYRHYAPRARVKLIAHPQEAETGPRSAVIGLDAPAGQFILARHCGSVADYAREIYRFFRECDEAGVEVIYCQTVPERGIGLALMDRLGRASEEEKGKRQKAKIKRQK